MKIRNGQVANRPIYLALAVPVDGNRDVLRMWAGDGGEGAKHWLHVLTGPAGLDTIAKALEPVSTAATEDAATERFMEFAQTWGKKYPAPLNAFQIAFEDRLIPAAN